MVRIRASLTVTSYRSVFRTPAKPPMLTPVNRLLIKYESRRASVKSVEAVGVDAEPELQELAYIAVGSIPKVPAHTRMTTIVHVCA